MGARQYRSSDTTPYSTAPLHQQVIYSPLATIAGDMSVNGQDCMGVGEPGLEASLTASTPTFYAFVNVRGPQHAVTSELVDELPTTPQQEVGFPANHRAGPQIILWANGMGSCPSRRRPRPPSPQCTGTDPIDGGTTSVLIR